jgi:hypothetical protein
MSPVPARSLLGALTAVWILLGAGPALAGPAEEAPAPSRKKVDVRIDHELIEIVQANIRGRVEVSNDEVEAALNKLDADESGVLEVAEWDDQFITIGHERFRCPEALFASEPRKDG